MGVVKSLAMTGAIALSMLSAARAADMAAMPEIPSVDGANAIEPELGTNWYLRGDIGYKISNDPIRVNDVGYTLPSATLDSDFDGGLGVGYDWGWFRMDLTGEYMFRNYDKNVETLPCGIGAAECHFEEDNTGQAFTVLLNAYFDLGTWEGVTPYVGGGIGVYTQLTNNDGWGECAANGGTCPLPFDPSGNARLPLVNLDRGRTEFAYALMAGLSYAINPNLAIDAGYRYLWIHDGQTDWNATTGVVTHSDHHSNEVRLGFRWTVD
jgi:opacity protein-like surface antigen